MSLKTQMKKWMSRLATLRGVFVVAAVYDGVLGLMFLFFWRALFEAVRVPLPNHGGYVQFPALLLIVFAVMFAMIAARPQARRELIPWGMALKASFAGLVLFHWAWEGVPWVWKPLAVVDLLFLAAFVWAWMALGWRGNHAG
ncbi:MAG: hypothetical protein ACOCTI_07215 [Phycisphaeraceae bacterium]